MIDRREMLLLVAPSIIPLCTRISAAAPEAVSTTVVWANEKSPDARLGKPKTLNDYFPFTPPKTKEEWQASARKSASNCSWRTGCGRCRRSTAEAGRSR